jgi:hypothetical protein
MTKKNVSRFALSLKLDSRLFASGFHLRFARRRLKGEIENLAVLKHLQCLEVEETEKMERKTKNFSLHFFKF